MERGDIFYRLRISEFIVKYIGVYIYCLLIFQNLERVPGAPKTRVAVPDDILAYLRETDDTHGFCFPWAEDTVHVYHNFWERLLCIRNGRDGWLSSTVCSCYTFKFCWFTFIFCVVLF